jgi:hypothetical protein|tara:strand:+ start:637 stop:873 length:237 start_codon:yes stop_codon:yes gene_type:complete
MSKDYLDKWEERQKKNTDNKWTEDPDVQDFLERADNQGEATDDDKVYTVGGLTNDKEGSFMKWINKITDKMKRKNKTH